MDENVSKKRQDSDEWRRASSVDQFPQPTISSPRLSSSTASSQESRDPYFGTHAHAPAISMDSAEHSQKRRTTLMNHQNGSIADALLEMKDPRQRRQKRRDDLDDSSTHEISPTLRDDGQRSGPSSVSASDDVELNHFSPEEDLTDDEETGLTNKDLGKRKRKKIKHTQLNERVMGAASITEQVRSSANKNVLKALIMNALLIASWYTFSLSISIVRMTLLYIVDRS